MYKARPGQLVLVATRQMLQHRGGEPEQAIMAHACENDCMGRYSVMSAGHAHVRSQ